MQGQIGWGRLRMRNNALLLRHGSPRCSQGVLGALTAGTALWVMYGALLGSLGAAAKWAFTGRLEPHAGFQMYDSLSFRRALVLISEVPLGEASTTLPPASTSFP